MNQLLKKLEAHPGGRSTSWSCDVLEMALAQLWRVKVDMLASDVKSTSPAERGGGSWAAG